jgi:hypothetical protein
MKRVSIALLLLLTSNQLFANQDAEALFDAKCQACHIKSKPTDMSKMVAPAIMGVMRHVKMEYPNRDKAVEFMVDYIQNPTKEKSICMPQKIEKFGLMPSQKETASKEELEIISGWLYDNFPPANFRGMRHGNKMRQNR